MVTQVVEKPVTDNILVVCERPGSSLSPSRTFLPADLFQSKLSVFYAA